MKHILDDDLICEILSQESIPMKRGSRGHQTVPVELGRERAKSRCQRLERLGKTFGRIEVG